MKQTIDIPFVGGVDESVAEKVLPPDGRLVVLENGRVNQIGAIEKRGNFVITGASDSSNSRVLKMAKLQNQELCFDRGSAYKNFDSHWTPFATYYPMRVSTSVIVGPRDASRPDIDHWISSTSVTIEETGDTYRVFTQGDYYFVIEEATGAVLQHAQIAADVQQNAFGLQCVRVLKKSGGYIIVILYIATSGDLKCRKLDLENPLSAGTTATLANSVNTAYAGLDALSLVNNPNFFAASYSKSTAGNPIETVVCSFSTLIPFAYYTHAATNGCQGIGVGLDTAATVDHIYTGYSNDTANTFIAHGVSFNGAALSTLFAPTAIGTLPAGAIEAFYAIAAPASSSSCRFFFGSRGTVNPLPGDLCSVTVSSAGAVTRAQATILHATQPISRAIVFLGNIWFAATTGVFWGTGQNMVLLCRIPIASDTTQTHMRTLMGRGPAAGAIALCDITQIGTNKIVLYCPVATGGSSTLFDTASGGIRSYYYASPFGVAKIEMDFDASGNYATLHDTLLLADGQPYLFDGVSLVESDFTSYPEELFGNNAAGGSLAAGTYQWKATYEWQDSKGRVYQSAPSPIAFSDLVAAGDYEQVSVYTLQHTDKANVKIVLWRTLVNGTVFYREMVMDNNKAAATVSFQSGHASGAFGACGDAILAQRATLYTDGGALDNIAAPAARFVEAYNNRLFLITDEGLLLFSKFWEDGLGTQFTDAFQISLEKAEGELSALGLLGGQLIIAQEHSLHRLYGDGPNNLGVGSFVNPQKIDLDFGVVLNQPILSWPGGLLLPSEKGLWNIGQDFGATHIGQRIRSAEASIWRAACRSTSKAELHLLLNTGIWTYNYEHDVWAHAVGSSFASGVDAAISSPFGPTFTYYAASNFTSVAQGESFASTIATKIKTGWIRPGNITGFSRLQEIRLLGEFKSAHTLNIRLHYEDGTYEDFSKVWSSSDEPYIVRMQPARQQEAAFQLEIWDSALGSDYRGAVWHGISLDVVVKRKHPLKAAKTL